MSPPKFCRADLSPIELKELAPVAKQVLTCAEELMLIGPLDHETYSRNLDRALHAERIPGGEALLAVAIKTVQEVIQYTQTQCVPLRKQNGQATKEAASSLDQLGIKLTDPDLTPHNQATPDIINSLGVNPSPEKPPLSQRSRRFLERVNSIQGFC